MPKVYRPSYDEIVDVYWNATRKCYSIRPRSTGRVCDHTDAIMLDRVEFIVDDAGRQRVLRTRKNHVHAWVSGHVLAYKSINTWQGMAPLNIFEFRDLTVRRAIYNPYKHNFFVRATKPYEPIVLADHAHLGTFGIGRERTPIMDVFRRDMWGEFTEAANAPYIHMHEWGWATVNASSPLLPGYKELERAGIIWGQEEGDRISYFFSERTVSQFDPHVVRFGPSFVPWGFVDETDFFHIGYQTEGDAYNAFMQYAERL